MDRGAAMGWERGVGAVKFGGGIKFQEEFQAGPVEYYGHLDILGCHRDPPGFPLAARCWNHGRGGYICL